MLVLFWALWAGGLQAGSVRYQVEGRTFEGYHLAGASQQSTLVLLVHDWDGLTGYEMKRADMLAALGYRVFAADLFGVGVRPTAVEDKKRLTGALYQDRVSMRALLAGALAEATRLGGKPEKVVALGYCFGGAAVLELARSGADLKGVVSVHGGLETPAGQDYNQAKGHLLIQHGSADEAVPLTQFATLVGELERAGVKHEATSYSGAPHAFSVFGSDNYRADADAKSWRRFTEFLGEVTRG
ncbi:dienelactone hydrolase family protein [Aeromonas dhakensis]|nr:dienelactone hydrolase family protein [Aeromonas dhakensis]MCJ2367813.1 dienelactone hydrolase family protein [Aeromonas dhakensis]